MNRTRPCPIPSRTLSPRDRLGLPTLGLAALALAACGDDGAGPGDAASAADGAWTDAAPAPDGAPTPDGAPAPDGQPAPDAAPAPDGGVTPDAQPGPQARGIAAILSDYRSMSLTLYNPATGVVERERCVDSGTRAPTLTQAFSGDVVLPSAPLPDGQLVLIDRGNGTLTWVDPVTCRVERQISVATGFFANPHDVVQVGQRLYVSRYERNPNPTPAPGDFDEGDDVLIVDLGTAQPVGRIDLSGRAAPAAGTVLPRPDRLVRDGDTLYVTLGSLGPNFSADEVGHGRVVAIDLPSGTVRGNLDVTALQNCGGAQLVREPKGLLLSCNGNFGRFDGSQIQTSGLAWLPLDAQGGLAGTPEIVPATVFGRPLSFSDVLVVEGRFVYTVVPGEFGGAVKDAVWVTDRGPGGASRRFFEGASGFVLGTLLHDPVRQRLWVAHADRARPRVAVFDVRAPGNPVAAGELNVSLTTGLPPVALGWY